MAKNATNTLSDFTYDGINRRGESVQGVLTSRNMDLAKAQLRKQGIKVRSIKKKPKPIFEFKKRITSLDITIFVRQLATMIKAGVPLTQAFEIVAESIENPSMKTLVLNIKTDVEAGSTFASSLRKHPNQFDNLFCSLVESGEQSGSLDTMLERIATYKEKSELLKAKVRKAIKYPIVVLFVAIAVTVILLVYVVPKFEELFANNDSDLPGFTQMVVNMSDWMQNYWIALLIAIIIGVVGFIQAKKNSQGFRDFLDTSLLKVPIFGKIAYQAIVARFSRTLSTTFAAGVPLIEALESTAGATNNVVFYNATQQIKEDVATGQQLHFSMRNTNLFPVLATQMVSIGEESGSLDEMLDKVATYYENEVDHAIDGLASIMEPIIIVVLGIIVGGLVVAMYLPIFNMGSVIG